VPTEPTATPVTPTDLAARTDRAHAIVRRNVMWSLGIGLVPLPFVDFVGLSGVQLKMLRELAKAYDMKFSEQLAKKIIATLVTGLGSVAVGGLLASTFFKFVPLVGTSLGVLSMPVVGGAFTLATGNVFVAHFEAGGTLLDFKPHAIREHFRAEFERAKQAVTQMKAEESAKQPAPPSAKA
jgi:uncharacterized protein (DUF697 family)